MNDRKRRRPDDYFKDWKEREALAEGMIPMVGQLSREHSVKCYIYGKPLVNRSVLEIMKDHRYVLQVESNELSEFETYPVIKAMSELGVAGCIGASCVQQKLVTQDMLRALSKTIYTILLPFFIGTNLMKTVTSQGGRLSMSSLGVPIMAVLE